MHIQHVYQTSGIAVVPHRAARVAIDFRLVWPVIHQISAYGRKLIVLHNFQNMTKNKARTCH